MKKLRDLKNVGKATLEDLHLLDIYTVEELAKQDPTHLFHELQRRTHSKQDPCVWDVFAAIIHEAKGGEPTPWWKWTPKRKNVDTKESLLQAALKVFADSGYHGSSVADIAKKARVSKALFYHYFESKNDLLVLFAKQRLEEWIPLVEGLETIPDPKKRITFLIDFVLSELETRSDWLRFLYMLYLSKEGIAAIEQAMKKHKKQFGRLFAAEQKLYKDLGYADPEEEATYLRSVLQGISLEYLLSGKNYPLKAMKKKIMKRYIS